MDMLILNPAQQAGLEALNNLGDPTRRLSPVPLTNGDAALSPDLLTDCAEGQTWELYAEFLQQLPQQPVPPELFRQSNIV